MAPKALVVDDDELILDLLEYILERDGYRITRATDGDQAIKLLAAGAFDVVITDLQMGQTNGIDVIRQTKNTNPETIAIMITGCCDQACKIEALHHGADDFLLKPFAMSELLERIHLQELKQYCPPPPAFGRESRTELVSG